MSGSRAPAPSAAAKGDRKEAQGAGDDARDDATSGGAPPAAPPATPDLSSELAALRAEAADLKDRWLRARADYENLARRASRDSDVAARRARAELVRGLLPAIEALGLAEAHLEGADPELRRGVALVHRDLHALLSRHGVVEIPAEGHPFDAKLHHALERVETSESPPGTILGVVAKGYTIDGEVLRPALVRVAAAAKAQEPAAPAASAKGARAPVGPAEAAGTKGAPAPAGGATPPRKAPKGGRHGEGAGTPAAEGPSASSDSNPSTREA